MIAKNLIDLLSVEIELRRLLVFHILKVEFSDISDHFWSQNSFNSNSSAENQFKIHVTKSKFYNENNFITSFGL